MNKNTNNHHPSRPGEPAGMRPVSMPRSARAGKHAAPGAASSRPQGAPKQQGRAPAPHGAHGRRSAPAQQAGAPSHAPARPRAAQPARDSRAPMSIPRGAAHGGYASSQDASDFARDRYSKAARRGGARSKKKGKGGVWTAVLVLSCLVLALCLGALGVIGYGYWHGSKVYDEIAQQAFPAKEDGALASMTVDWDALLAQNPDTVAWIYMPGTSIDYPVVQGESDEEYLKKDFTGDSSGIVHKGTIFLSTDNAADFSDANNVLYGHNMNDDTMFAHLLQMTDQATFDAARTFYVLTPTQNYRCSTFALDVVDSTETSLLQFNFADQPALASYMDERVAASVVEVPADVDAAATSKLFTLITCGDDYAATRAVLFGAVVESAAPSNA